MRINHASINEGGERLALDKRSQSMIRLFVRLRKHFADNIIAAGRNPESSRLALIAEIVDHRPRVENLRLAEAVAVVPLANLIKFVSRTVIFCHSLYFIRRKAEVSAVLVVQHGVDGQVVHAAENALLRHPQNAGKKAERQMLIILEPARKQVSHKLDDLVVVVLLISLLNRRIILVNDDDGRNAVVLMEHCR